MDKINDRWGEFVITPALMMGMDNIILDRISFGGVKAISGVSFDIRKGEIFANLVESDEVNMIFKYKYGVFRALVC